MISACDQSIRQVLARRAVINQMYFPAAQVLRRLGYTLPIVAMTANASDRDRDECLNAGMDGFLSKPVLKNRLAEAIVQVISGRARYKDASVALAPLKAL